MQWPAHPVRQRSGPIAYKFACFARVRVLTASWPPTFSCRGTGLCALFPVLMGGLRQLRGCPSDLKKGLLCDLLVVRK